MAKGPKAIHSRSFLKEPARGEWVPEEIPTVTVKKANRYSTMGANAALSSYTPSGTAYLRLTYLRTTATGAIETALVDRDGTLDIVYLEAAGAEVIQGNPKAPIHTLKGTFKVYNVGSVGAGTYAVAWEGVR